MIDLTLPAFVTSILTLGAGYAGLHMQTQPTEAHKTSDSRGVVGQVAGPITLSPSVGAWHADRGELRLFLDA